jgi:hypothetical protein
VEDTTAQSADGAESDLNQLSPFAGYPDLLSRFNLSANEQRDQGQHAMTMKKPVLDRALAVSRARFMSST